MPVDANAQAPEKEKKGGEKKRCGLERAMGFEPTTTSLGS
jgi:hypothetical protein